MRCCPWPGPGFDAIEHRVECFFFSQQDVFVNSREQLGPAFRSTYPSVNNFLNCPEPGNGN